MNSSKKRIRILTIDLEEWFHILDVDSLDTQDRWDSLESRVYENTHRVVDILKKNNVKATFFVLGWIAKKYPDLIRQISDWGYEIGTHSQNHILINKSTPSSFKKDLKQSKDIIEDLINKKIRAFRAPGFSINEKTTWAFDILEEEGIEIDSSIFPAKTSHGGVRDFGFDHPFLIKVKGSVIKEFPMSVFKLGKLRIPFSGGGYFRILPLPMVNYLCSRSDYLMTYFHPRDFDKNQPVLEELSLIRKFKSYGGLKKSVEKFHKFVETYEFVDIATAESLIRWDEVPQITINGEL